ncbi:hypothetical protein EJ04DRAFT_562455 [Polyplosphaeria fusca]|uniref:Uncharacterized protein n=1 Tax=Polyplosphaeria fusca TaxID=682080 RepID=A0A9P4R471_9PLEO|nr:hypothetical protein EJ04DRAFT_562455 [Polyplosphaeria fusca]
MAFKESRLLAEQPGSLGHYTLHALHDVAPAFPSPLGVAYSNLVEIFARPAHTQPSSQSLHSFSTRHNRRSNRHTTHGMTPTTPAACVRGKGSYGELLQASATAASDRQSSFDDSLTTIPYTPNRTVRRRRTKTEPIGNDITSSVLKLIAQKADAPCYAPTTNAQQEISSIANIYGEATSPTLDVNLERLGVDNPFESIQSWRLISNTPISALSPTKKSRQTHPPGLLSLFAPSPSLHSFTSSTIHDETFSDSPDTQSNPCSHASEPSSAIPSDEGDCTIIHHTAPRASSPANPTPPTQTHAHRHRRIISSRLLDLKASATKVVDPRNATHRSGRKISLRIPIKPSLSHAPSPTKPDCATVPVQAQRELEYQHRHTFIGTGSLDDFLEALDTSSQETPRKLSAPALLSNETLNRPPESYRKSATNI